MLARGSSHKRNDNFELEPSDLIFNPSYDPLTLVFIVSSEYVGNVRPYLAHAFAQDFPADHLCAREEPERHSFRPCHWEAAEFLPKAQTGILRVDDCLCVASGRTM